jgi:arylamine N-acetyltransferase
MLPAGYSGYAGLAAMVVDGTLQPASEPFTGLVGSDNLGSTQHCFGSHYIAFVKVDGRTYLCDVGAGPKCLVEPVLLRAYDDTDSSGPSRQPPPADWLAAHGEYQQCGMRFRLRRGIMGSAEPLSTAAAMTHPERDSFVGYYLQVC